MAHPVIMAEMPIGFDIGCLRCGAPATSLRFSRPYQSIPDARPVYLIDDAGCTDHPIPTGASPYLQPEPRQPGLTPNPDALGMERADGQPWLLYRWTHTLEGRKLVHVDRGLSTLCGESLRHGIGYLARDVAIDGRPVVGVCLVCWSEVTRKPATVRGAIDVQTPFNAVPADTLSSGLVVTEEQYREMAGEPPGFARVPSLETPESGETWHVVKSDAPAESDQAHNHTRVLTFWCGASADRLKCTTATLGLFVKGGPGATWCDGCRQERIARGRIPVPVTERGE